MESRSPYLLGFIDRLEGLEKSALSYAEMTPAQRAKDDKLRKAIEEKEKRHTPVVAKREADPETFSGWVGQKFRHLGTNLNSIGRGALSTLGVAGLRTAQNTVGALTWLPRMADSLVFGKLLGVDRGRGLTGRLSGRLNRMTDKMVDKTRRLSSDYDYENQYVVGDSLSKFNRFMSGRLADATGATAGSLIGFGGVKSLAKGIRGAKAAFKPGGPGFKGAFGKGKYGRNLASGAFGTGFALMDGYNAFDSKGTYDEETGRMVYSPEQQLRAREEMRLNAKPRFWKYIDPTATEENIEKAPTRAEFLKYNTPASVPAQFSGSFKIPTRWARDRSGAAVQFRPYYT